MLRIVAVPLATAAGVIPLTVRVHAVENQAEQTNPTTAVKTMRPSELPIYGDPPVTEYEFIPEKQTAYQETISSFRKSLWAFMDTFQDTTEKAKDKLGIAKSHSNDLLTYIQEDAGFLPRAVIITVAGLGGVVAGYRGRIFRKAAFSSIGMITAASICYPNQAVDISRVAWGTVKKESKSLMRQTFSGKKREDNEGPTISERVEEEFNKELDNLAESIPSSDGSATSKDQITTLETSKDKPSNIAQDFGQSKAEDKDMYTTRGS